MEISFKVLALKERSSPLKKVVQLMPSDWDDFSFKTSFSVVYFDGLGRRIELGVVKIGYKGQPKGWTKDSLPLAFETLPPGWFSLGQDVDYYKNAMNEIGKLERDLIFDGLKDLVANNSIFQIIQGEKVFVDSLMRNVSATVINGQFKRVLDGLVELSDFHFSYHQEGDEKHAEVKLDFKVVSGAKPSTNVHVIIGRNGVGKTTLLNNMVDALMGVRRREQAPFGFSEYSIFNYPSSLSKNYFSSVVSVSFSAFDPFLPPIDRVDRSLGPAYFYVGMKNARYGDKNPQIPRSKTDADLVNDLVHSFKYCISQPAKKDRWRNAVKRLESDVNFAEMNLTRFLDLDDKSALEGLGALAGRMSSGHSIVLLTITKLVETVEEKTLILLDEPESHLHPPLLSAFTRALSDLLHNRNGVAIVATHSPVVLQEVPKSCVWKLTRIRSEGRSDRPERETFGENVGILTREIFGLEVSKSGFHEMMQQAVDDGGTHASIVAEYDNQLGAEAKAILLALIAARNYKHDRNS